ncbi:transcription antitermination factor NusB [Clostridium cochlearium]|uniref:Transcription antitermination protein NusB n=1 Tax=Clostridium cochlearium TaxID=1494 RepID=A0A1G9H4Y4_CLOCO|nr:transcription antitermination factor NusB [Clostridium cochlearium]MBV1816976.1 transcription antitermination factor NusB [Bacteroidales bacterium MSK.15.36]NSJ90768.1 transcription antitermination factor NusB [Coprococcus sp. MSK.21.13]MBE6065353.1 transcription antitermination factor NusB [Clostridium cochlearium]MBU5268985.1 transcription antitermination factor NusB [Clostridium cochlearium]MCG4570728.1 transcription antitermination factor NusB [Clostridium cochlearium]
MKRKKSREMTMQLLFEMIIKKENYMEIINTLREASEDEEDINGILGEKKEIDKERIDLDEVDLEYLIHTLKGVQENIEVLDEHIEKYLKNWTLNRLAKVDLAILRLCSYEILFSNEVPNNVAINEAVELAKKYGDDKSPAFINAILDKIAKQI